MLRYLYVSVKVYLNKQQLKYDTDRITDKCPTPDDPMPGYYSVCRYDSAWFIYL